MRLSREKIVRLSHCITDQLVGSDDVEFIEDRETIRQHLIGVLNVLLKEEERIDTEVRKKITSQKKDIPEGSAEWDILFKKYYSEEMKRIGAGPER
ncbi:MAG: DUF507 family protein [Acidipila sp.]|nr:DUF507 family protein [Acidipila sp.]